MCHVFVIYLPGAVSKIVFAADAVKKMRHSIMMNEEWVTGSIVAEPDCS